MHEPPAPTGVGYGREVYSAKASRQGVIAALIVSSEAWRCSEGAYKIREASLSAKEGSGSGCALPHRPPCLRRPRLPKQAGTGETPCKGGGIQGRLRSPSRRLRVWRAGSPAPVSRLVSSRFIELGVCWTMLRAPTVSLSSMRGPQCEPGRARGKRSGVALAETMPEW
jgi:hypothetical protein